MSFSERLKDLREQKGITQVNLSKCLYMQTHRINHFESEIKLPNIREAMAIAKYFGVRVSWLAFGEGSANDEAMNE